MNFATCANPRPEAFRAIRIFWVFALFLLPWSAGIFAAEDYTWIGAGETNKWSDPGNWDGGVVPPDDGSAHVIFQVVLGEKVALDGHRRVHSITCNTTTSFQIYSVEDAVEILTIDSGLVERTVEGTLNFKCALAGNNGMHFVGLVGPQDNANMGERFWIWGLGLYKGETRVTNAVLRSMGHADRIPDQSRLVVEEGAIFDLHGRNETVGSLTGGGVVTNTLPSLNTLTVGLDDSDAEFWGAIGTPVPTQGRTIYFVKRGSGTQVLAGVNEWIGSTAVLSGILHVESDLPPTTLTGGPGSGGGGGGHAITLEEADDGEEEEEPHGGPPPTGLVQVFDGAMLTGPGSVGDLQTPPSPALGGAVSPGNGVGRMAAESADLRSGYLRVELPSLGIAGTDYDQLKVAGEFQLNACSYLVVDLAGFSGAGTFNDVVTFGTPPVAGYDPSRIILLNAQPNQSALVAVDADSLDVTIGNSSPEPANVFVSPGCGLVTSEAGTSVDFEVSLSQAPQAPVTITFTTSDPGEGTVTASVNFEAGDTGPYSVTLTGVDDPDVDGNIFYLIEGTVTASGPDFDSAEVPAVAAVNLDDDGITVSPAGSLETWELAGPVATFRVVLNAAPLEEVLVPIQVGDLTEGSVFPDMLVFGADDWNLPKTVTVSGLPDGLADGDVPYLIAVGPCRSEDPLYAQVLGPDIPVTNRDVDGLLPGVTVTTGADLQTSESGDTATFSVVLNSIPAYDVIVPLVSSDIGEGIPVPGSLLFRPADALTPRTVTVFGVDDLDADGDQAFAIETFPILSNDPFYLGLDAADAAFTNLDNEAGSGIRVTLLGNPVVSESGGVATFEVVLRSQPLPDTQVDIAISVGDPNRAALDQSALTFLPADALVPQSVVVTALDNWVVEGNVALQVVLAPAISGDPAYDGVDPADVSLLVQDDDRAGVVVEPIAGLVTGEDGTSDTFAVALASVPSAPVHIAVYSSLPAEGVAAPGALTFLPDESALLPQTVTVTGVDDPGHDGSIPYLVLNGPCDSSDPYYDGMVVEPVMVLNLDNDDAPPFLASPLYAFPNPAVAGQPVMFFLAAADPEGEPVSVLWDYGDGTSNAQGQHVYPAAGIYSVEASISDGSHIVTATLDVIVQGESQQLHVKKLKGLARFDQDGADRVTLNAILLGVPEDMEFDGAILAVNVGGAQLDIPLAASGSGKSGKSSVRIRRIKGTDMAKLSAKLAGSLKEAWTDEGVEPGPNAPMAFVSMSLLLNMKGLTYTTIVVPNYKTNRKGTSASFVYTRN